MRLILTAALLTGLAAAQAQTNTNILAPDLSKVFKSDKEKFSYFLGMYFAAQPKGQLKRIDFDVDYDTLVKGFRDNLTGGSTLISESQMRQVGPEFGAMLKARAEAKAAKTKAEGEKFLAENKKQPGVITMTNGLQYKILKDGTGATPTPTDQLKLSYVGTLPDGTEFDSSKPDRPFPTTSQGQVIQGWKEVLPLMKVGSKWKVWIPTELAYGERSPTPAIPANSPLVFEMELLSAEPAPAPTQGAAAALHPQSTPLTSDIIKVPSKEEMDKGAKVETIKAEDLEKARMSNNVVKP
jgi:FKBP-type peptidyl-prolyl cis-trans isomerase